MKAGLWFYALGTILTGMLNLAWGAFDSSHQPIQAISKSLASQPTFAYTVGILLIATGFALLWPRTEKIGAIASAIAYSLFATLWIVRYAAAIQTFGLRIDVLLGVTFGLAQQIMLLSPALLVYAATLSPASPWQHRATITARWMLGVPPIIYGLFHFVGIRVFATIVPQWMPFGYFWAAFTGAAFFLAGCAICSGIQDVLAARLLALMLILFELSVEIPPIFIRLHNEATWGAAVYNITATGACWIFAEWLASRAWQRKTGPAEKITMPRRGPAVA